MIQTKKMQNGDKTPILYNLYEDQYNFNDLSRAVDSGINDHISTLRKGKKYEREFREAVANIMSGVKDGTITFGSGRFNDSLGRYTNDADRDKDVYGWAANYVYNTMQGIPKYVKQDTSKKYDNTVLGRALAKTIFGTDNGNIQYFWDVDALDPQTNTRGINGRIDVLNEAISQMNVDDILKDYSDSDRATARQNLQQASQILQDGISPGESLKLSKIFGGINWNNWMRTDFNQQQPTQQQSEEQSEQNTQSQQQNSRQQFFDYINTNHPLYNGELSTQVLNAERSDSQERLSKALSTMDNNKLQQIDLSKFSDPSKRTVLTHLIGRKLLPYSDNVFIIPSTQENETVLTYDPRSGILARKRTHELSYYRKKWINDYNQQYGTSEDNLAQYFTEFKKNGGILKAQTGTKLWYSGLATIGDYDPVKYTSSYNTSRLINADMQDDKWDPWVSNIAGIGIGRYKPTTGSTKDYTQGIENTQYYKNFGKALLNPDGTFTDVGLAWAKAVDAQLPKGSLASFYDDNGNLRSSWTVKNQDVYGRQPHTFNNLSDYVNYVRNDQILGSRHNVFLNEGNRYFYKDQDGVEHWVDPNEIDKYIVSKDPVRSQWSNDRSTYWNDYELTGLKSTPEKQDKKVGSDLFPRSGTQGNKKSGNLGYFLSGITPDLIGAGRLFASLRTNNNVARTINESLKPVLKDTYERYSPITGAFGEMQFRNRQAADLRRQASRPFTSDASLQLAGQLDADRQARDLEYQGFLADNNEIKRTQAEALARQEDNMARRSEVANFNRASMNQTNREKAQLEATRLKSNWQSIDNFLQGVESRLRQNWQERQALAQQVALSEASDEYQRNLGLLDQKFKSVKPNATIDDMLADPKYVQGVKNFRRRLQYDNNNILLNRYRVGQYQTPQTYDQILNSITFSRKGGSLHPTVMYLINKVIKNENNA